MATATELQLAKARLASIEALYSTERGATQEEWMEARRLLAFLDENKSG